ncbi:MAG: glutamate mutase L [Chloroflexota bacterium]
MNQSSSLLVIGTDLAKITLCLLESIAGSYRLAYWQEVMREPGRKTVDQVKSLCQQAERQLSRRLWNDDTNTPYTESDDPLRFPPVGQIFITSSPRPRLRVWLSGLSERYSLNSATLAVQSSPAEIGEIVPMRRNMTSTSLHQMLSPRPPDTIVLSGGFDVPSQQAITPIRQMGILYCNALMRMAPIQRPHVLFTGNRWAADAVQSLFVESGLASSIRVISNVQPYSQWATPISLIHGLTVEYWQRCRRTSEYRELSGWLPDASGLASLELNFARLTQGWMRYCGLDELHGLYEGPDWWMHVWSRMDRDTLEIAFSVPNEPSPLIANWPTPQLVSGLWPQEHWIQPARSWCDKLGIAPCIAAVGHALPLAMIQVLETDIF